MDLFAIAAFVEGKEPIGARIINIESGKVIDLNNIKIKDYITTGHIINNLDIVKGKIHWKSGVYSRYPMIYRDGTIENSNIATVAGESNGSYKIVNYEGKIAILGKNKLVEYSKKFGISNCKVNNNDGNYIIQPISGELSKFVNEIKYRMMDENTLTIDIPEDGSVTELEVPILINGLMKKEIDTIIVNPKTAGRFIKKLALPENIGYITYGLLSSFTNLEVLICKATRAIIDEYALANRTSLRQVYIKGIYKISKSGFEGCTNLEKFAYNSIGSLGPRAFANCKKLNINDIIKSGIENLNTSELFSGCRAEEIFIDLPTNYVTGRALRGIQGLKKITIENSVQLEPRHRNHSDFDNWSEDSNSYRVFDDIDAEEVVFYTDGKLAKYIESSGFNESNNYGFKDSVKVTIIDRANSGNDKGMKITKAKVAGVKLSNNDLTVTTREDIATVIMKTPQKEVRDFIVKIVNAALSSYLGWGNAYAKLGDYNIEYRINYGGYLRNCSLIGEVGCGLFYGNSTYYTIFPTDKYLIYDYLLAKGVKAPWNFKGFYIPKYALKNKGKIDNIEYNREEKQLVITFRSKKKECIDIKNIIFTSR